MSTTPAPRGMNRGATLDWSFGWADPPPKGPWLETGETIASYTVTVEGPLTKNSDSQADGLVTAWVTCAADASVGAVGAITCAIVTSAGRADSRRREIVVT